MTRNDLIDSRALIVARHLCDFGLKIGNRRLSEAKAATLAYSVARAIDEDITKDDARIARVAKGAAA